MSSDANVIKWLNISGFLYEYEDERITKYQPQPASGTALYRLSADLPGRHCVRKYTKNAQKNIKKTKKVQSGNAKLQAFTSIIAIFCLAKAEKSDLTLCNLHPKPLEAAIQSSAPAHAAAAAALGRDNPIYNEARPQQSSPRPRLFCLRLQKNQQFAQINEDE